MFGISNSAVHNTLAIAEYLISYVNDRHSQVNLFESLVHESVLNHNPLRHRRAQTKISHSAIHFQDFHGKMSSAQIFIKWTTISSTSPSLLNVTRYHKLSTKNLSDVHNLFPLKIASDISHVLMQSVLFCYFLIFNFSNYKPSQISHCRCGFLIDKSDCISTLVTTTISS